jgi:hypothetical protein
MVAAVLGLFSYSWLWQRFVSGSGGRAHRPASRMAGHYPIIAMFRRHATAIVA